MAPLSSNTHSRLLRASSLHMQTLREEGESPERINNTVNKIQALYEENLELNAAIKKNIEEYHRQVVLLRKLCGRNVRG
jgi:hypothetical protein